MILEYSILCHFPAFVCMLDPPVAHRCLTLSTIVDGICAAWLYGSTARLMERSGSMSRVGGFDLLYTGDSVAHVCHESLAGRIRLTMPIDWHLSD